MRRIRTENINTPAGFDAIYGGDRRREVQALPTLRVLLPALEQGRVLDVGCGWGQYRPYLYTGDYVGIDFSEQAIAEARERCPKDTWVAGDFRLLEHWDGADFETIICLETLEHVEDPAWLLGQFYRLLRYGGLCIIGVPYRGLLNHCGEHVWEFDEGSWEPLLKEFASHAVTRFSVGEPDMWEHFLVVARK